MCVSSAVRTEPNIRTCRTIGIGNSVCVSQLARQSVLFTLEFVGIIMNYIEWNADNFIKHIFLFLFFLSLLRCIIFSVLFLAVWRRGSISKQQHNEHNHTFVFIIVKCPGLYKHHSSQATSFVLILLCLNSIRIRCFISRNYYLLFIILNGVCDRRCIQPNIALVRQTATAIPTEIIYIFDNVCVCRWAHSFPFEFMRSNWHTDDNNERVSCNTPNMVHVLCLWI